MKLLMLLLALAAGQQLTWYELYERGEKHFAREEYRQCIADMDQALASKNRPERNVFTRAVQKIDYKPFYYKAMAFYRLGDLPEAYQFAQRAFRGQVVRELPLLQSDLAKILEDYSVWMEGQHKVFQAEKRSLEGRRTITKLIAQDDLAGASATLSALEAEDPEAYQDLRLLIDNQTNIRKSETELKRHLRDSIEQAVGKGSWDAARKLIELGGEDLPSESRDSWMERILEGEAREKAIQEAQLKSNDAEELARMEQQNLEENQKIVDEYEDKIAELERLATVSNADLAKAEQENDLLTKELEARQSEVPSPPKLVLAAYRELGKRVRLEGQILADLPIRNRRVTLNGHEVAIPESDWKVEKDGIVLETEISVPTYGSHQFILEASDATGRSQRQVRQITLATPFWYREWFRQVLIALPLVLITILILIWWMRRRRAQLRNFNPYIAGSPVREKGMFYGRDQLLARIEGLVHKNCFMIHGERRIGKTSLLLQLKTNLMRDSSTQYEFFPVFIDLQGIREEELFHHLMGEIVAQAAEWSIPLDDLDYADTYENYQNRQFSRDIKRIIGRLKDTTEKHVVVVLLVDEVDVLNEFGDKTNQKLRGIFMKEYAEYLSCVMAGIHLKKEWESSGSPWYNFFEEIPIDSLDENAAKKLILRPVRGIFKYQPEAVAQILRSSSGHPYLIQKICVSLVDESLRKKRFLITKEDVERYLSSLRKESQEKGVT